MKASPHGQQLPSVLGGLLSWASEVSQRAAAGHRQPWLPAGCNWQGSRRHAGNRLKAESAHR